MQSRELGAGGWLARALDGTLGVLKWLVLPISALLFLQWPLREVVQQFSREANDLGQILFALYVAASVSAATRAGTHLTANSAAHRYGPRTLQVLRIASNVAAVLPWLVFISWSATPSIISSVKNVERFQDSLNHGYFIVKLALWLLALTLLIASLLNCRSRPAELPRETGQPS
jgi:TRAP-type C4-dicarboxylate transport system permease small subunit